MCSDLRRDMMCIKTRYFNINRILLLALGLWPYQQSILVRLQIILLFIILISSVVFQFTTFLTTEYNPRFVTKTFSYLFAFIASIIKYNSFRINNQSVKHLLDQLQYMYNQIEDKGEISIIEEYGYEARAYTIKIALLCVCSVFIVISFSIWQSILCTFLFTKECQLHHPMQIQTEYFVDEKKYSSVILIHMSAAFSIAITAITGTGSTLIAYLKHACGMFRIASYRIEQAMIIKTRKTTFEKNITIYKKMIYAVDIHRKAMVISEFLRDTFEKSFFFLVIFGVASLCFNLLQVSSGHIEEIFSHSFLTFVILLYMFLANKIGQEITDHNEQVFITVYSIRWYTAPLHIQRLILFLLQRSSKSFDLSIGGLFVPSLECFAKLLSTSMSYFTVLYSMQK